MSAVLRAERVTRRFGGVVAVRGVDLAARAGEILAIIGPNGAGKTTLFNVMTGLLAPTSGDVYYREQRVTGRRASTIASLGVIRTFQNLMVFPEMSVLENAAVGAHRWTRTGLFHAALGLPLAGREDREVFAAARAALGIVGLGDRERAQAGDLPFGQQRLLEIARALVARPSVLLLDEPTAGLTAGEAQSLVTLFRRLRDGGVALVVIEHNMDVVMEAADRVAVLDYGEKIAEGTPAAVQRDGRVIAAYLGEEPQAGPPPRRTGAAGGERR
jgi:branched-chain amino acid transport system ATP-binding protein